LPIRNLALLVGRNRDAGIANALAGLGFFVISHCNLRVCCLDGERHQIIVPESKQIGDPPGLLKMPQRTVGTMILVVKDPEIEMRPKRLVTHFTVNDILDGFRLDQSLELLSRTSVAQPFIMKGLKLRRKRPDVDLVLVSFEVGFAIGLGLHEGGGGAIGNTKSTPR
jgi:hypothetical protein